MAFSPTMTALSKSTKSMSDIWNRVYYCNLEGESAKLYYNVRNDSFDGDYGTLGINPLDSDGITAVNVATVAVHDISRIVEEAEGYDFIRLSLQLYAKQDNYSSALRIPTYMPSLWLDGFDTTDPDYSETRNDYQYVFEFPREWSEIEGDLDTNLNIPINFTVLTGADFENYATDDLYYSNYKIAIMVELIDKDGNTVRELPCSRDDNYIIYTNARLLPDFIVRY